MSINEFSATVRSKIYQDWLSKLDSNIINKTVDELRKEQQTASKTDFLITQSTLKEMFETLSGSKVDHHDIDIMMRQLAGSLGTRTQNTKTGKIIKVGGKPAVLFENIGFDTITSLMKRVLDTPEIEENLHRLSLAAQEKAVAELKASGKKITPTEYKKADNIKITLGDFYDKGHVVSIAANLGKEFLQEIRSTEALTRKQKELLEEVLQKYINKLQADDLATANLPNEIETGIYASYIKSPNKYLVEFQSAAKNQQSGRASIPIVTEMRALFKQASDEALKAATTSSALGEALVTTKGSPSFKDLLIENLVSAIDGKKSSPRVYISKPTEISSVKTKVVKPKKSTQEIAAAKRLLTKLKQPPKTTSKFVTPGMSTINLQDILNSKLRERIERNMGTGNSSSVLNYRTGRFSSSVKVEKVTKSRQDMISVFYNYMKYPYATFSDGGRQQYPRSRDPKLLISKSIREIAQELAINKLRAVSV